MHVIARKALINFWTRYPDSEQSLSAWFHEAIGAKWRTSADVKRMFGSASVINAERVVFNVCGNKYRLVVRINYGSGAIFIRFVGTHAEYDAIDVETV
jgi:mRNA interferase HigB